MGTWIIYKIRFKHLDSYNPSGQQLVLEKVKSLEARNAKLVSARSVHIKPLRTILNYKELPNHYWKSQETRYC